MRSSNRAHATSRSRSLLSRLLLAMAPVALVVTLLICWVAAPLLQTPGAVARAEHDLTQVQRYQRLLTLVEQQSLHWSEYQYLPEDYRMGVRAQMRGVTTRIDELREEWHRPPAAATAAFEGYSRLEESAQESIVDADSKEQPAALQVLVHRVLPASRALRESLRSELLSLSEPLSQSFSELAGNLEVSFLGRALADRLRMVRAEIQQSVVSASIEDLVIQEASEYAGIIVTGDPDNLEAIGLHALVTRDLATLTELLTAADELDELGVVTELSRLHTQMTRAGEASRALVRSGQRDQAAMSFEQRLDPILLDRLLPLVTSRVAKDRGQVALQVEQVNTLAARLRLEIVAASLLLLVMLTLPIVLVGLSTVRPLRKIRQAAEEVTAGDLSARTGVSGASEVGALAQAFDHMAARVESSRASLLSAAVLAAASDVILIVGDGTVRHANGATASLLGLSPEALVGRSVASLVHPDDQATLPGRHQAEDLENTVVEARFATASGWVDTEVTVSDLRADPDVNGLVLSVHDTTERKQVEIELASARDAAIEASRLKSDFLATMSHEIRTPMNGVIGLTDLLLSTELDERQTQYVQGVHGAGEALLAIINDILDFSKVEAGKLELEALDFDLVQVVEDAALLVADTARLKGLELVTHCAPAIPSGLRGDPSRIRQVLLNLISNAVKFTASGEVVAHVQLLEEDPSGVVVRFAVTDTGVGIAAAHQHRLFDPFTQEDSSTTRQFGGTGLGLAISHRLVTAMGGAIGLESEEGVGSTFWVTLPLGLATSSVSPPRPISDRLTGVRALVVDDNKTNRLILSEQLGAWGVLAEAVEDGATALRALREAATSGTPYTLVLLDYWMPQMDGLELAAHISEDPDLQAPLLLLLSSAPEVSRERAREAGIAQVLTKPVRRAELYAALQHTDGRHDVMGSAPAGPAPVAPRTRGHLLVVEDNATNQMVAVGILASLGFSTEVAANGAEALEALARRDFVAVLMDCHMPVMDGYTATTRIRQDERGQRHTPVFAMTAGVAPGDRERCLAAGMDDYISKPVKPQLVEEVLDRWLGPATVSPTVDATAAGVTEHPDLDVPAIDLERVRMLQELESGENSFFAQLVESLARRMPDELLTIQRAVQEGDHLGLVAAAHRLKGGALNLGAVHVGALCQALEDAGEEQAGRRAAGLVEDLPRAIGNAVEALRAEVASSYLAPSTLV